MIYGGGGKVPWWGVKWHLVTEYLIRGVRNRRAGYANSKLLILLHLVIIIKGAVISIIF